MTKIGITGGCGYVGSRLALTLFEKGYNVYVIDKATPKERNLKFPSKIKYRKADLTNYSQAEKSLSGIDVIVHLAANMGPLLYMEKYQADILRENCAIDSNVYPIATKNKVRALIYSSSSMVFQHPLKFPYKEEDITKINPPTNIYGFSKLVGEYFCRAYNKQYGLDYVIIRYHNIYGPGEDSKGSNIEDVHVIPSLLKKILIKKQYPLELLGNPESTRPFVYIDDAVEATSLIVERAIKGDKKILNNDFNIATQKHIKIKDLAEMLWNMFEKRPFKYKIVDTHAITAKRREVDTTKIKEILRWKPKTDLKTGIKKTADWILEIY